MNKEDLKQLIIEAIEYKEIAISELKDHYSLYEKLDYDGTVHEIIESNIDIYYYNLRQWAVDNWKYVEDGRKAGKMPPIQSIYEWIQNKRSVQSKIKNAKNRITATKSLAFVIARKIGAKGTPKQPFVQPALQKVTVATHIERMEKYIADSLEK